MMKNRDRAPIRSDYGDLRDIVQYSLVLMT